MHEFLVSTVAFVVLVGLMVVVHEFGHFAVAKLCKVRVEAFSFGFGPRLFGFKYGETDYKVCLLPLGGYVKMTGETPDQIQSGGRAPRFLLESSADPGSFLNHPRWQRILIGLAGPSANFVLALVLMVIYFGWINEVPAVQVKTTTAGMGDARLSCGSGWISDRRRDHAFRWLRQSRMGKGLYRAKLNAGQAIPVTVERGGQRVSFPSRFPPGPRKTISI